MGLLEMKNINKSFGKSQVLNQVHFSLKAGTVHALMGENGAGKSTLMKILAGVYLKDSGEIYVDEAPANISSPTDARQLGIAMIHQELSYIPQMTVAENIFLGREPGSKVFMNYSKMYEETKKLLQSLHLNVNPKAKMNDLKIGDQQLIEIAKAISIDSKIIVMDEPTSALSDKEVEILFEVIARLKKQKKGIIYISHKMDEIFKISDEITVLRDGCYINSWKASETDNQTLIKNMVGRELNEIYPKVEVPISDVVLEIKNLSMGDKFKQVNFKLRKGEILGIAGLEGAGRTEVMNAIFGLMEPETGEVHIDGKPLRMKAPEDAIKEGIAYVTNDRKRQGLILPMSVGHNATLSSLKEFTKRLLLNSKMEKDNINAQIKALKIKVSTPRQLVSSLSGGNQQKVVLAKWLMKNPRIFIMDEPTRGIDVGAKAEIYRLMCDYVSKGNSIIMISSELPEIMGMSDRILVMSNGYLTGELDRAEFDQEIIMKHAFSKL